MERKEIIELFKNDLYKNCDELFITSDNKVFIKYIDAVVYCDENKLSLLRDLYQVFKPIKIFELTKYGFKPRYDTFESYMLNIEDLNIIVDKHNKETKFKCWLINNYDGTKSDEICVNDDCTFEWVMSLVELLKNK